MEEQISKVEAVKTKIKKKFPKGLVFVFGIILGVLLLSAILTYVVVINVGIVSNWFGIKTSSTTNNSTTVQNLVVTQDEADTINIVKNTQASVVSIAVSQMTLSQTQGAISTDSNIGTGFVIDAGGLIVTNQHVVSDTTATYKVVTSDGSEYDVQNITRDDVYDIAILKINATNLKPLTLGDSDNLSVGQDVIAIGTPLGEYAGSVTKGIISGLHRTVTASSDWFDTTTKTYEDVIQTDAAINPGNSGGPLLDSQGEVIGINFATTSGADSISFALPINRVKERIEEYRTYGKFIQAYLGVAYEAITSEDVMYHPNSNIVAGAYVDRVEAGSPADKAGVKQGDIITELGGDKVSDSSLSLLIGKHKPGDVVAIKLVRNGAEKDLSVTLTEAN
jgi:serine protease Do